MTMSRSVLNGRGIQVDWPIKDASGEESLPRMRIGVVCRNKLNILMLGHIVTHLDAQAWADLNGYVLLSIYPKRYALPHERTDLF